jgi:hypothetical protein
VKEKSCGLNNAEGVRHLGLNAEGVRYLGLNAFGVLNRQT